MTLENDPACPLPINQYEKIVMAHGSGGRQMQQLIDTLLLTSFDNAVLNEKNDSAVFEIGNSRLAFTTDSYVVNPLFFPGGDIGKLAVCGTLNDLAMSGAHPLYISCGLIIEEGFPIESLQRIVKSMSYHAKNAGVEIVTGDTKVVEHGKGDGLYINTTGIGLLETPLKITPPMIQAGDVILINGDIGRHGIAIMAAREGFTLDSPLKSDCADVSGLVRLLISAGLEIHCMRDLTRGGLATSLVEISASANKHLEIYEQDIEVPDSVRGVCELLGLDPCYVANEGRFVVILPESQAAEAIDLMRSHPLGENTVLIGKIHAATSGMVTMKNRIGTNRIMELLSGAQLPRIC